MTQYIWYKPVNGGNNLEGNRGFRKQNQKRIYWV